MAWLLNTNLRGDSLIIINDKALNYAKKNGFCFEVKVIPITLECWNGTKTQAKSLKTKVILENEIEKELYNEFEVSGIKVYIAKELKMDENVNIIQHVKLPFTKPSFGVQGVRV